MRWQDSELGWVNPEQFIPIAEESKLIIPLGNWILETSIKILAKWVREYDFKGIMSVNVSPVQL
ncbi:MAG: EAL domain-containing protein, partial [Treponema sp.]|nr:EAL domain-containing protein [Treponema sp.]